MRTLLNMQNRLRKLSKRNPSLAFAIKKADETVKNSSKEDLMEELKKHNIDTKDLKEKKIKKIFKK